ncbi:unnamed protein product [Rotaria socialis]|uniref:G-protein coupled receptors family 2 profile 1 domain-containing protein n=1 Tax=Rotaria socialis TaxID=392032 RepID=A0A820TJS9_9BILA|nr:unnamed protein product [Rotaria socialis]
MMLLLYLISIFNILQYSYSEQCPSSTFCSCSSDLTIITCTHRQLSDESFINLNSQLPQSTIVLNLSSNFFKSINSLTKLSNLQTLDLSFNKIEFLPSNLFSKFPQLSSLYISNNSLKTIPKSFNEVSNINLDISNNPFNCSCQLKWLIQWFKTINLLNKMNCQKSKQLLESDFCFNKRNYLFLTPEQSQIVYENDPFTLNCSSNTQIYWTLNEKFYSKNSTLIIPHLLLNHSGLWICHSLNLNRSISIHVLSIQTNHFCQSLQMDTSKGHFYWPRALTGQIIQLKCPFGSAAWLSDSYDDAKAFYTCSSNRQWIDLDLSQCAFRTNISREFDLLLSKNSTNLLSKIIMLISKTSLDDLKFDDIIFLIDLIDEEKDKYLLTKKNINEFSKSIYRLTDFILQINQDFSRINEYQLALNRLRFILEMSLNLINHPWMYDGTQLTAMTFASSLPPNVCSIPNRDLLTFMCGIPNQQYKRHEPRLATIQFRFESNVNINQSSIFRIIFYRTSALYAPDFKTNENSVIYMMPATSTNVSSVTIIFYGQSNQASIGILNSNMTSWQMASHTCQINRKNINLISTECTLTANNSLSITYLNHLNDNQSLFLNANYLDLAIYVSSTIASVCFVICILFYICCHKVYLMPRSFFHCLINYWLSLAFILPLFAFGVKQITIVDYDDDGLPIMKLKAKSVIQFYFLAYGISFIICGINVAISRDQYTTNKICFLNNFESLLTLIIPIGIFIFLLLIFLLSARINIKRLTKEAIRLRNLPDESEIEPEINDEIDENIISSKPNEVLPIIIPSDNQNRNEILPHVDCHQSHLDSLCSSDMDHQHQPSNQLLSILFQLILLSFIFLSSLSIYIHPLHSFNIRLEHSIYTHLYGIFVLLLAFYIIAFYVLSRNDLTMHCQYYRCCRKQKKKLLLNQSYNEPQPPPQTPQQSPSSPSHPLISPSNNNNNRDKIILNENLTMGDDSFTEKIPSPSPPHSHYSPSIYQSQVPLTNEITSINDTYTYGSKRQTTVASKYYARHRHILKTSISTSESSLQQNESSPHSTLNTIQQEFTTTIDDQQAQCNLQYGQSSKKSAESPTKSHIIQNGNAYFHLPPIASPQSFIRPSTLPISPRVQSSPSQAIIRPLPIIRLSSPTTNKILSSPTMNNSSTIIQNGHTDPTIELNGGRNSYRVMPSPTTEERRATYVYLNKNSNLIQQENSLNEKPSIWKKPPNGHHPHVAYIDEDDECSVSLKSSTCDSTTATSSSTTSPVLSRKNRSKTISSSSSSTYSNDFINGALDINQITLHESSV